MSIEVYRETWHRGGYKKCCLLVHELAASRALLVCDHSTEHVLFRTSENLLKPFEDLISYPLDVI